MFSCPTRYQQRHSDLRRPSTMAIAVLPQRAGSPLTFRGIECKRGMQARSSMLPPYSQQLARWCLNASRRCTSVKAARNGQSGPSSSSDFNLAEYIEAKIENVAHTDKHGHIIFLRLLDGKGLYLPVYIGDSESNALEKELQQKQSARPMTHDFMKMALETLGYRVTKVRVTALVGNTYHARVHMSTSGKDACSNEVDIDARPSDAINLAVRFNAPVYVNKQVAGKMGATVQEYHQAPESHQEIRRSCKAVKLSYHDPTVIHQLNLQVAIAEERFDDACLIRDNIDKLMQKDRALSLLVAMESALEDGRFEEAMRLRDAFKEMTGGCQGAFTVEGIIDV